MTRQPTASLVRARRGSSATTLALTLGVMTGFAALTIDVGMMVTARGQLQNAYDAAALGAVGHLDGTPEGVARARASALALAQAHSVLGASIVLPNDPANISFGRFENGAFTAITTPDADPDDVNAVRVQGTSATTSAAFARIFGVTSLEVASASTAGKPPGGPASAVDCPLPLAIQRCRMEQGYLSWGNANTISWGIPEGQNASASSVRAMLDSITDGTCDSRAEIGGEVALGNGVQNTNLVGLQNVVNASTATWNTEEYGAYPSPCFTGPSGMAAGVSAQKVLEGPVMIVDHCGQPNQKHEITGFAWATIYDFNNQSGNNFKMCARLDMTLPYEVSGEGGGPDSNIIITTQTVLF